MKWLHIRDQLAQPLLSCVGINLCGGETFMIKRLVIRYPVIALLAFSFDSLCTQINIKNNVVVIFTVDFYAEPTNISALN